MKKIIIIFLFFQLAFNFYHIEQRSSFGWDQERDAQVIWQIIKEGKPTLIGPRTIGPNSFFLGPLWFYILLPFYLIFNMNPLATPVAGIIIGVITTLAFYLIGKRIFGEKVAVLASFLFIPIGGIVVWNPIFGYRL